MFLNKFIEESDTKRAKTLLNPLRDDYYEYSIPDSFGRGNMINNIIIDADGIVKNKAYVKDKGFRRNLFVFLDRIFIDNQNVNRHSINHDGVSNVYTVLPVEKFLCEHFDDGIDIYSADLRELLEPLDEKQRIYAKRRIRQLRNTHKLKCELKAKGTYDAYKPYFVNALNGRPISELLKKELEII